MTNKNVGTKAVGWLSTSDIMTNKDGTEEWKILAVNPDGLNMTHITTDQGTFTFKDRERVYVLNK